MPTQPPSPATPERMTDEGLNRLSPERAELYVRIAALEKERDEARREQARVEENYEELEQGYRLLARELGESRTAYAANHYANTCTERDALRARCSRLEGALEKCAKAIEDDAPAYTQEQYCAAKDARAALADEPLDDADYVHPGSGKLLKAARVVPAKPGGSSHEP